MSWTRTFLFVLLLLALPLRAAVQSDDWRDIERAVEFDPNTSIRKGLQDLQDARAKGDKKGEARALLLLSIARANRGDTAAYPEDEARGAELARELGEIRALCWYLDGQAWTEWFEGRSGKADALWDEALTLAGLHDLDVSQAWIYGSRGNIRQLEGRKAEAMDMLSKAYTLFEADRDVYGMAATLSRIGDVYAGPEAKAEDQEKAADFYRTAMDLLDKRVYRVATARNAMRLGLTHYRRKENGPARQHLESALQLGLALQLPQIEANIRFHLANLYRDEKLYMQALEYVDRALEIFSRSSDKYFIIGGHFTRAEALAELGRKKESMDALAHGLALLATLNTPASAVQYHPRAADVYARLGEYQLAFRQMQALRAADRGMAEATNAKLNDELKVRFEVKLKETENRLLRSQASEAESRRLVLSLALALSALLFVSIVFYLRRRTEDAKIAAAHMQDLASAEASRAEALQAANTTLEKLATVGHDITASLQSESIYDALRRHAGDLLDVSSLSIWLLENGELHLCFGVQDERPLPARSIPLDSTTAGVACCVREERELLVASRDDGRRLSDLNTDARTALFVPLKAGGRVLGALLVKSSAEDAYGERERQIVRTLAAYGAVALSNAANARGLVAASQAKSVFLANMSHELRSPLNAMLGFTRILGREPGMPAAARHDLDVILRSGEHLYSLINQVLDLSKIEAGRMTVAESDIHLYAMLDELADMFSVIAAQKRLRLTVHNDPDVPNAVRTDAVKLRQVLTNLLSNALKFTVEGEVALRVAAVRDAGRLTLVFSVTDTGPGIAPEDLKRLGEAFVQVGAGRQTREGTGLGLAISRSFVQLMAGEFHLSSRLGEGTTIELRIPVQPIDPAVVAAAPPSLRPVRLAPGQPAYRILAVDDREEGRQLLTRLLAPLGFEVREAANGKEAVELFESWRPHLIWMDMRMPVMDGREATRRIKATEQGKSTVVIALTASSFEQDREDILADGCDDFQRKPFTDEELFGLMRNHLGVEFAYEEWPDARQPAQPAERIEDVPPDLIEKLREALRSLDVDAIDRAIGEIRGHDPAAAHALAIRAENFEYDRIREMLPGE